MTRAQQTVSILLLASSIYMALYLGLVPLNPIVQEEIIPVLPFWALISFASYLLFRLGLNIATFNDVPEAHETLQVEIEQAKKELRAGKVDVDD